MSSSSSHCSRGSTSTSLIRRARHRDPEAWEQLVDLYGPLVFHWCRRKGQLTSADASDVFQEVFAAVSRSLDRFSHGGAGQTFRGWLWTITRNKLRDHYRRLQDQPAAPGGTESRQRLVEIPEAWDDRSADPDDRAALQGLFQRARELVADQFEERTGQAFWQTVVEGRATTDVAADLGMTPNTVRQYKSRVLRWLRQELGEGPA